MTKKVGSRNAPSSRGFTLVELLVVIAIISVLAAMLLPALKTALLSAREMACRNNMKQLYLGNVQYNDDYSHIAYDPESWDGASWGKTKCHLFTREPMYAYIGYEGGDGDEARKNTILFCPRAPREHRSFGGYGGSTSYTRVIRHYTHGDTNDLVLNRIRLDTIRSPEFYTFHFEGFSGWTTGGINPNQAFPAVYNDWNKSWHGGKRSVLFWDGHVKGLPKQILQMHANPYSAGMPGYNAAYLWDLTTFPTVSGVDI